MVPLARVLWVKLDGEGALHRQLYRALRASILDGRLGPDERLPSTRSFARELGLSRNTVLQAIDQLVAEGYASGRVGSGTYVASELPQPPRGPRTLGSASTVSSLGGAQPRLSSLGERLSLVAPPGRASWSPWPELLPYDFRYGEPSFSDLPMDAWSRILGRRARRLSARRLAYQPPGGAAELREALAGYLGRARGVVCSPDDIVIVHGSQQAVDLVARLLVNPGDPVVIEEPHYTGFSFCLNAAGASLVHIGVDEHGLRTDDLEHVEDARLVCVTPSHQYPTGAVLSLARRLALIDWATRHESYVLEDDYDGEFRFDGKPIECLQALDRSGRVIYTGTASKLLFPSLRIGWLIAPPALAPYCLNAKALADTGTPSIEQFALADFISEGHLERHARKARTRTAARRRALLESVDSELAGRVEVLGASAGLHVLMKIPDMDARDVTRLRQACRELGVGVYPAGPFYSKPPAHAELLLGYAALSEETIREGIKRLRRALDLM
ncbi:MAG TPA: PLP-dependent aminotransferase family protein [Candidatus Limnocylindrales bacterium]|nr:PLP-dependent aminotransferase family protein [Candidatus Limnocylindrales bacterium]